MSVLHTLLVIGALLLHAGAADPKKPNILFLFADDQSFETIRAFGHTDIDTPNLDRLVQRGTTLLPALGERTIGVVWQPISLIGTELISKPLENEPELPVQIVSRAHLLRAGIFEEVLAALATPHWLPGADANFPKESNLVVLLKCSVSGTWSEERKTVSLDLMHTTAARLEEYGVTLEQFSKLLVLCLRKNLEDNGELLEEDTIALQWKLPAFARPLKLKLPRLLEKDSSGGRLLGNERNPPTVRSGP